MDEVYKIFADFFASTLGLRNWMSVILENFWGDTRDGSGGVNLARKNKCVSIKVSYKTATFCRKRRGRIFRKCHGGGKRHSILDCSREYQIPVSVLLSRWDRYGETSHVRVDSPLRISTHSRYPHAGFVIPSRPFALAHP